jgi:hypothetical protein
MMKAKFFDHFYRIPRLLVRVFKSFAFHRMAYPSKERVALFTSGMHFQEATPDGLILSKAEHWLSVLQARGELTQIILNPFSVGPHSKSARNIKFIEFIAVQVLIGFIFQRRCCWVIEDCDPGGIVPRTLKSKITTQVYFEFLQKSEFAVITGVALTPELCIVANFLNIPTYEFQHGATPVNELDVIGRHPTAPKYLFVWDEFYSRSQANHDSLINIGYPKSFQQQNHGVATERGRPPFKILVSMSYGDLDSVDPTRLLNKDLFRSMKRLLDGGHEVHLRFHPAVFTGLEVSRYDAKVVKEFLKWKDSQLDLNQVKIDCGSSIFQTFMDIDFHLTFASSTVLEAAYCGVPSFVFCGKAYMPNIPSSLYANKLVQRGFVETIEDQIRLVPLREGYENKMNEDLFFTSLSRHF